MREEFFMIVAATRVYMTAEWVTSLKEKRMVVKSIVEKTKHKFNVSVAEIEDMDVHCSVVIGFSCVTNDMTLAGQITDNVLNFIENNTDAVVDDSVTEFFRTEEGRE
jgi:uncharacterized protein YlxP (DUF503 family)